MSVVSHVAPAPTATSMIPDINNDELELLFSGTGEEEESCCSQPSSSSTPSTPSAAVCLSSQEMSSQVPECDIARISFYLRCCVLGCDIMMNDDHNEILSTTLVDFTRATSLPVEYQNIIERLAFEDITYSFSNLQRSGVIHIDHQNQVLPPGVSTMFLSSNTPEFTLAMTRLYGNFVVHHPNLVLPQKIMICSLEWINEYYASPLERYVRRSFVTTTTATTAADDANSAIVQDQNQRNHGCDHQYDIASEPATSSFITATTTSRKALHHQHENEYFYYGDYDKQQGAMMMDDEDIPMVTAVPIFDDDDHHHHDDACCHGGDSSSSSSTTTAAAIKKKKEEEMDVVSSSLIIPGQKVKFVGLEMDEMNDAIGIVQERRNNRVIVEVADHQCDYSVRIENLMIVL